MRASRVALVAVLALAVAACDGSAPDSDLAPNTFTLRVDGGAAQTRADAYYGHYVSLASGESFAILLGDEPVGAADRLTAPTVGFVHVGDDPDDGRYALRSPVSTGTTAEGEVFGFYIDPAELDLDEDQARSGFYFAQSGTLTIEGRSGGQAVGSFEMTVAALSPDFEPDPTTTIQIEGAFNAVVTDDFEDEGSLLSRRRSAPVPLPAR